MSSVIFSSAAQCGGVLAGSSAEQAFSIVAKDGARIFARAAGTGAPLLFVHSWAFTSEMWRYQFADLNEQGFRTIAFDMRGHGRSDRVSTGYDLDGLADDLAAVVDALDLRDVVLVGHSMGAAEIIRYIVRHGASRVAKIVLLSPATPYLTRTIDNPFGVPAAYAEAQRDAMRSDFRGWIEANKGPFFTADTAPSDVDWIAGIMAGADVPTILACNRTLVETDLRADLGAINRPVLVIQGDKDASMPLDMTGRRTAAGITGASLIVYPGAPHGLFVTHRKRLSQDIAAFARA